jgi:hypothetical protein
MDESALRTLIANLEAYRSSGHWWLEFCTALVAIGVLFEVIFVIWEYVDELHDFRRGVVHPPERPNILLFALGLLGAGLVAIGVAGEIRFESRIESTETCIRKANESLFLLLSKEAGDAATSAKTAHDEADAVKQETDELTIRLGIAAKQLGMLEQDIRTQGPRWRLLKKAAPELTKQLSPFAGQRVRLFVCGRLGTQDGAKWKVEHGGLEYLDRGCSPGGGQPLGQGMMVFVNKQASQVTREAATALGEGFAKVLPPSPDKMPGLVDPDFSKNYMQPAEGKDTPWAMVANDPDLITMLIGAHPQQDATKSKTKANH